MFILADITEIRIHGRGGMGVVSAGYTLAVAAFYDNKFSQAFPMFGLERSGSPVTSYVRISNDKIVLRSQIYSPAYSIVLDATLAKHVDIAAGVIKALIINSKKPVRFPVETFVIDVSKFGFPNIAMVAAFAKCTKLLSKDSVIRAVEEIFSKKGEVVVKENKDVVNDVFKEGICPLGLK